MKLLVLILGSICAGASMKLFLFPFNIPSGGAAGISVLLKNLFHIQNGTSLFCLNVVLLLFAFRSYGWRFVLRTLFTVAIMSLTVNLLPVAPPIHPDWLAAPIGALCFGLSMSAILFSGSTTGGMDILAKFAERKWHTRFGTNLFFINSVIMISAGLLVGWHVTLFGICVQFLSNLTINLSGKLLTTFQQQKRLLA